MARFPNMLATETPAQPEPDPTAERLKQLEDAQAAAALERERQAAAEAARQEELQRLYQAINNKPATTPAPVAYQPAPPPQYTADEALANPTEAMTQIADYYKRLGQQEVVNAVGPVLEKSGDGTYKAHKADLRDHPYYKYAESELDDHFKGNPSRIDEDAVRDKFYAIVGRNTAEYQRKLEADVPLPAVPAERRVPVSNSRVEPRGSGAPVDPEAPKSTLSADEKRYMDFFNERYGLGSDEKEYEAIRDGKIFPGQRLTKNG